MGPPKREGVSQKSAAEFFSEHQQIAGFDNAGKSLFTSIRELVENSLDACESIHELPHVKVSITEYTETEHNALHGIKTSRNSPKKPSSAGMLDVDDNMEASEAQEQELKEKEKEKPAVKAAEKKKSAADKAKAADQMYYMIRCADNGCGIPEENIGNMLGRVLSGSKHGVRQTRGKFGLGAKMALIWSKKSSGLPIEVRTAHALSSEAQPSAIVDMVLDIDIFKNLPKIISSHRRHNHDNWRGTEITLTIAGNFSAYRTRILQYFQQLAVITPYADFDVDFTCSRDAKKSFLAEFRRRSVQMPPMATEVKPHPRSLNNITLSNLLKASNAPKVTQFLTRELSGINSATALKIAKQTSVDNLSPRNLSSSHIAALCQRLRDETGVRPASSTCLSPAGEYNLRLGVIKELEPSMVATCSEKPGAHEGHPFLIEAAISLGGKKVREGINVYRFANRIPLLFEVGADVVTQVATKSINWGTYHINPNTDRVGVYVSIVSTRIPFKGTSKEYIGEDVAEIKAAVKKCLATCALQLKANLAMKLQRNQEQERKKILVRYIPDISRSLVSVLNKIHERQNDVLESGTADARAFKSQNRAKVMADVAAGTLDEKEVQTTLQKAVDRFEADSALQSAAVEDAKGKKDRVALFLQPCVTSPPAMDHPAWVDVFCGVSNAIKILLNYDASVPFTSQIPARRGSGDEDGKAFVPVGTTAMKRSHSGGSVTSASGLPPPAPKAKASASASASQATATSNEGIASQRVTVQAMDLTLDDDEEDAAAAADAAMDGCMIRGLGDADDDSDDVPLAALEPPAKKARSALMALDESGDEGEAEAEF